MGEQGQVSVEEVLAGMRLGARIEVGGQRSSTTYSFRDGEWWVSDFDEGDVREYATREETIRQVIAREPEKAREVVRLARWLPFSQAFMEGGDPQRALALLAATRPFGDPFQQADVLEAFLRCPPVLDPEVAGLIEEDLRSHTAYHTFMDAARWDRSPETGRKGVLFVERLIAMVGVCPGCFKVRSSFHEQAGDLGAALADLERELAQTPGDSPNRQYLEEQLERVRARLGEAGAG